jgi:hypothetical protein
MVMLRVKDGVKQKTLQIQSCREFHGESSGHKIHLISSWMAKKARSIADQAWATRAMWEKALVAS